MLSLICRTEIIHIAELCPFDITPVDIKSAALYYFAMVHEFAVMGHFRIFALYLENIFWKG